MFGQSEERMDNCRQLYECMTIGQIVLKYKMDTIAMNSKLLLFCHEMRRTLTCGLAN